MFLSPPSRVFSTVLDEFCFPCGAILHSQVSSFPNKAFPHPHSQRWSRQSQRALEACPHWPNKLQAEHNGRQGYDTWVRNWSAQAGSSKRPCIRVSSRSFQLLKYRQAAPLCIVFLFPGHFQLQLQLGVKADTCAGSEKGQTSWWCSSGVLRPCSDEMRFSSAWCLNSYIDIFRWAVRPPLRNGYRQSQLAHPHRL